MSKPDIHRLLELQKLLTQFSQIERMTHRKHKDAHIYENDTEHSYNLALTAWFLAPHFPELDRDLIIRLALVHDLVELHAGDTYIYGSAEELATKAEREAAALKQLAKDWPDFPEVTQLIHDYEKRDLPEAKFVYALDKIMPIMLIYIHEGYTWKQKNITADMLYEAKHQKVALSPEIKPYFDELYELLLRSPQFIKRSKEL